ncbi:MAG: ABC transporter substrate-binding protein [Actinomycetes bacterium]
MRTVQRLVAVIAAASLLAACSGKAPDSKPAPTNATFTYINNLDVMTSWDPATSYSNEGIATNNLYEQLTRSDPKTNKVEPLLATKWVASPDGLTWTFTLRDKVKFTTGNPMDAAAVKAALDRTIELAGGGAYIWDPVKTITAKDPATLVFDLKYAAPLDLIASSAYAAFIYDTKAVTGDLAKWFEAGHAAGTGAYVVDSWKKGTENELTLKANKDYWGGWSGVHYQSVVFKVVQQETTAVQMLQSGQGSFMPAVSSTVFASLKGAKGVTTEEAPSFQNMLAMLNTASGPLADVNVRKAVAEAIDYDGIITTVQGGMVKGTGVVPPGLLGYTTEVQPTTNAADATKLLTAAGYGPGGKKLSLVLTYAAGDPVQETVVTVMKANLASVGVDLQGKALAWETQWDLGKSTDASKHQDIFLFYWYPDYADPYSWFINLFRSATPPYFNLSYWDDKAADTTIDGLQAVTATDRPKAEQQYVELQKAISDQAVTAVLGVINYQRALASTVQGYVDNPSYGNVVFVYQLTPTA